MAPLLPIAAQLTARSVVVWNSGQRLLSLTVLGTDCAVPGGASSPCGTDRGRPGMVCVAATHAGMGAGRRGCGPSISVLLHGVSAVSWASLLTRGRTVSRLCREHDSRSRGSPRPQSWERLSHAAPIPLGRARARAAPIPRERKRASPLTTAATKNLQPSFCYGAVSFGRRFIC